MKAKKTRFESLAKSFETQPVFIPRSSSSRIARRVTFRRLNRFARDTFDRPAKKHAIDFFLPVVLEQIGMGLSAGLDLVPALQLVSSEAFDQPTSADNAAVRRNGSLKQNPVNALFADVVRQVENGVPFAAAIEGVRAESDSLSFAHCCTHLVLAHQHGGQLVEPLRELSDATQQFFQFSVEERIAKLPVLATAPLLLIFLGLIVMLVVLPMMRLFNITGQIASQQEQQL